MRVAILLLAGLIALLHSLGVVVMHDHAINVGDGRAHIHSFLPDDHGHVGHIDGPAGHAAEGHAHDEESAAANAPVADAAHADAGDSTRQRAMTALMALLLVLVALAATGDRTGSRRDHSRAARPPRVPWPQQRERLALLTVLQV